MCVHGYMSIEPKTGHRSAIAPAKGLRRRVIFELDAEQLPLLDGIRERHGSTRAGLIAALEAEAAGGELGTQLAAAKARAEQAKRALERGKKEASTARRKGDTEAKAAVEDRKALAAELEDLRRQLAEAEEEARQSEADYEEALEEFREEVSDLEERAVEWLFCARCGEWVSAGEWIWEPIEGGGQYAYHERCGDHKPGLLPSSWLAQRPSGAPNLPGKRPFASPWLSAFLPSCQSRGARRSGNRSSPRSRAAPAAQSASGAFRQPVGPARALLLTRLPPGRLPAP